MIKSTVLPRDSSTKISKKKTSRTENLFGLSDDDDSVAAAASHNSTVTSPITDNGSLRRGAPQQECEYFIDLKVYTTRDAKQPEHWKKAQFMLKVQLDRGTAHWESLQGFIKKDLPVEQLENLKLKEAAESNQKESSATVAGSAHLEYHSIDAVKENGELVSRLEQHASADAAPGSPPDVHTHVRLDVPAAGVHRDIQDGDVSAHEATTPVNDELTTKVFHGAARLIQTGAATNVPQQIAHTAVRRAYNADITKETKNNMDHYSSYAGVQYSPLDMAEYVFWTGDEKGVTVAIEEFLQEGLMSKEEAINFLQEIKMNIDYLRTHYRQNMKAAEESDKLRTMLIEQANAKESYQYRPAGLQRLPFANTPDIIRNIQNKNWEMSNSLTPTYPILPVASELRPESVKRSYHADPMMQTNIIGTSDFERDGGSMITEEEYEEMMEKLKAADSLYTEYTLEEIIYQLAKMMFSQSLTRDPREARAGIQRFMTFLELEAERGQLSRSIEKKVLDVMVAALTDTIGDHPELMQGREQGINSFNSGNRLMHQFLDRSVSSPGVSRAILAAYKDELLKGPPMHKLDFNERN